VALQALRLKPGNEVIVPAYTCAIVFEIVLRLGLKPVFVDVDRETYNINHEKIPEAITPATKAIVPVHLFGHPCDMDSICEISNRYGLFIVEDVAQALGAEFKGKKVGVFGDLAIFSFGPGKSITGGEGGAIAVNNEELVEQASQIHSKLPSPNLQWVLHIIKNVTAMRLFSNNRLYALVKNPVEERSENTDKMILRNCLTLAGKNMGALSLTLEPAKMPNISAAILCRQLMKLDELNNRRIENAMRLTTLLSETCKAKVKLPTTDSDVKNTFTRYVVRILEGNRESAVEEMSRRGIDAKKLYHYVAATLHQLSDKRYACAEELSTSLLGIPNHPLLTESDLEQISSALQSALEVI